MTKTFRKAMISTIAMLVVAVMSLTGVTYAWFTQGTDATVTSFDVSVQAADGSLTLAMPNEQGVLTWTTNIAPGAPANALRPVSNATGAKDAFYHATISGADSTKLGAVTKLNDLTFTGADNTTYNNYYAFDFYINNMTSANQMAVTLKANTGCAGDSAKALRIAFIQDGYMTDASGAFNQTTNYDKDEASSANTVIFEPNSTATQSAVAAANKVANGNTNTTYAISSGDAANKAIFGHVDGDGKTAQTTFDNTTTAIATLPGNTVAKVTVVIWLEGQDVDCNNDIAAIAMTLPISLTATFTNNAG